MTFGIPTLFDPGRRGASQSGTWSFWPSQASTPEVRRSQGDLWGGTATSTESTWLTCPLTSPCIGDRLQNQTERSQPEIGSGKWFYHFDEALRKFYQEINVCMQAVSALTALCSLVKHWTSMAAWLGFPPDVGPIYPFYLPIYVYIIIYT